MFYILSLHESCQQISSVTMPKTNVDVPQLSSNFDQTSNCVLTFPSTSDSKGNYCPKLQTSKRKRRIGSKDLQTKLHTDDPQFIDFLRKCLEWDPAVRWTPDEALRHPWLKPIVPRTLQTISPNTSESLPAVTPSQIVKKKGKFSSG